MAISFPCGACAALISVDDSLADQQVRCPQCQNIVLVTPPASAISAGFPAAVTEPAARREAVTEQVPREDYAPPRVYRHDDDYDVRWRHHAEESGGISPTLIAMLVGGVLGILAVGGLAWLFLASSDEPVAAQAQNPPVGANAVVPAPRPRKEPVEGEQVGILRGRIRYDGAFKPEAAPVDLFRNAKECVDGAKDHEKIGQRWIVSDKNEVANAVVYLKPPKGQYFKFDPQKQKPTDVFIDQPHCAFDPHVVVLFPTYFDGTKQVETRQKFFIKNSSAFPRNYKVYQTRGPDINRPLAPKMDSEPIQFKASYEEAGSITNQRLPWMSAVAWAFDHPYAACTGMDGTYEIRNIPIGVELDVTIWHEGITPIKATKNFGKDPIDYSVSVKPK